MCPFNSCLCAYKTPPAKRVARCVGIALSRVPFRQDVSGYLLVAHYVEILQAIRLLLVPTSPRSTRCVPTLRPPPHCRNASARTKKSVCRKNYKATYGFFCVFNGTFRVIEVHRVHNRCFGLTPVTISMKWGLNPTNGELILLNSYLCYRKYFYISLEI